MRRTKQAFLIGVAAVLTAESVPSQVTRPVPGGFSVRISTDHETLAFKTAAALAPEDTNNGLDVYLMDRRTGAYTLASCDSYGNPGNRAMSNFDAYDFDLSPDGNAVVFRSPATNFSRGARDGYSHVYRKNLVTGRLTWVDTGANSMAWKSVQVEAGGNLVLFQSSATNLHPDATNGVIQVFLADYSSRIPRITLVSVNDQGDQGNSASYDSAMSADGSLVSWTSYATNLAQQGQDQNMDLYLRDMSSGDTTCLSVYDSGADSQQGLAGVPSMSADGRYIGFLCYEPLTQAEPRPGNKYNFVHDRVTNSLFSPSTNVPLDRQITNSPHISGDGQFVTVGGFKTVRVGGSLVEDTQVYRCSLQTGQAQVVSLDWSGRPGVGPSYATEISDDGQFVSFYSSAPSLGYSPMGHFIHGPLSLWAGQTTALYRSSVLFDAEGAPDGTTGRLMLVEYRGIPVRYQLATRVFQNNRIVISQRMFFRGLVKFQIEVDRPDGTVERTNTVSVTVQ